MANVLTMRPEGTVSIMVIPAEADLDEITVFWQNYKVGQGKVTITCFGASWTTGFWSMGDNNIQQFFKEAGWDYLVNKLSINNPYMKQTKFHHEYLARIVKGIQKALGK